ncbi:hypothetical protein HY640_01325 [Candidatus Woesearchaeota archaeon]|nr:hypothetical protein [Candidatus Woesearchaeota archaeon]
MKQHAKEPQKPEPQTAGSTEEQIGFHKGALTTLAKERQEFTRILTIVEQLMQMHLSELKKLGVDLEKEAAKTQAKEEKPKKPIEDILR